MKYLCDVKPDGEIIWYESGPQKKHNIVAGRGYMYGIDPVLYIAADSMTFDANGQGPEMVFLVNGAELGREPIL